MEAEEGRAQARESIRPSLTFEGRVRLAASLCLLEAVASRLEVGHPVSPGRRVAGRSEAECSSLRMRLACAIRHRTSRLSTERERLNYCGSAMMTVDWGRALMRPPRSDESHLRVGPPETWQHQPHSRHASLDEQGAISKFSKVCADRSLRLTTDETLPE